MGRTIAFTSLLMIIVLALVGACGNDDDNDAEEASETPEEILEQASERFTEVESAHFLLEIQGEVSLGPGILLRGAEGDIARPNSAEAEADITFGGTNLSMTMIAIGEDQYITNFVTGQWEQAPEGLGYNPAILFDQQEGIASVLQEIEGAEIAGTESVDGRSAYHIEGHVARETVQPMTGGAFDSEQIDLGIWVDQETYDVVRIVLRDSPAEEGAEAATWTLQISNQNEPVTIERPEV